jgi:integrase
VASIIRAKSKGKTVYRVRVRVQGHTDQSASFHSLADAKQWAAKIESSLHDSSYTVADLINRYVAEILPGKAPRTSTQQAQQMAWWSSQIGHRGLASLVASDIELAISRLAGGPATKRRYLAVFGHALSVGHKRWDWLAENPMVKVTKPVEPKGRIRFLTTDERQRLLVACQESRNPYLYTVVIIALSTGARKMEILGLTWDRVDLARGVAYLDTTKNGDRRSLPLAGHALELLRAMPRSSGLVFPGRGGITRIDDGWRAAVKRAEIQDFVFHDLRHDAASRLAMSGASLAEIAALLGHRSLEVTRRYAHLSTDHLHGLASRLDATLFGG